MNKNEKGIDFSIPLFFKLWIAFVFSVALFIIGVTGYLMYQSAYHPETIGEHVGRFIKGIEQGKNIDKEGGLN